MTKMIWLVLLLLWAPVAGAADFTVHYGVYAGGIHALEADIAYHVGAHDASLRVQVEPSGVLGTVLPWAGTYESAMTRGPQRLQPRWHDRRSNWRDEQDHVRFDYDANGMLVRMREFLSGGRVSDGPLDAALHDGTRDMLTTILAMLLQMDATGSCAASSDVFDGKRRYRMAFTDLGAANLPVSSYNMVAGPTHVCQIELQPLLGFKKKLRGYFQLQEEARARKQLPRIWLAPLWPGGPNMPVRFELKSEYGAILLHAQRVTRPNPK